jgi:hypothetical protein
MTRNITLLLGSVAERVAHTAPRAVLTVRQPRAKTAAAPLEYDVEHLPA